VGQLAMDSPRRQPIVNVVFPAQFFADLVQRAVHQQRVLGRAGTHRPLAADLHADDTVADNPGCRAPVPAHRVRPASASVVEYCPGLPCRYRMLVAGDRDGSVCPARDILHRVLEEAFVPRHDDSEALVPAGAFGDYLETDFGVASPKAGSALNLVDL